MSRIEKLKFYAGLDNIPDQKGLNLFAAMLINECMDVARKHTLEHSGLTESYDGKILLNEAIKEHFSQ